MLVLFLRAILACEALLSAGILGIVEEWIIGVEGVGRVGRGNECGGGTA